MNSDDLMDRIKLRYRENSIIDECGIPVNLTPNGCPGLVGKKYKDVEQPSIICTNLGNYMGLIFLSSEKYAWTNGLCRTVYREN